VNSLRLHTLSTTRNISKQITQQNRNLFVDETSSTSSTLTMSIMAI